MTNLITKEPEQTTIFDLRFNQIVARRYWSNYRHRMTVRIDLDSKSIGGLGLTFSIEQAKELLNLLPLAIDAAERYAATLPAGDE